MKKTIQFLKSLLHSNDSVVIACSGGPDSMCLLSLLLSIRAELNLNLIVAHVNHKVRQEAEEEAHFVKKYAQDHQCQFFYLELPPNSKENFESYARAKRYEFFREVVEKKHAQYLCTAHHGDDLIETILMRLTRGSNLKGYSGFPIITSNDGYKLIRPLIFYSKEEIKSYLDIHHIPYCIDQTNNDDDHTRNRYRHYILPFLKKENPRLIDEYLQFNETLTEADNFINNYTQKVLSEIYVANKLNLTLFKAEDKIVQKRIIAYLLSTIYLDNLYLVNNQNISNIINSIYSKKPNIFIELPLNYLLIKSYNTLEISHQMSVKTEPIVFNHQYQSNNQEISEVTTSEDDSNFTIRLNSQELFLPLIIRTALDGDRMTIKNMQGTKKIKDIYTDCKLPKIKRLQQFVLLDSKNNIIWLPGLKKSKFAKEKNEKYDIILKYKKEGEMFDE